MSGAPGPARCCHQCKNKRKTVLSCTSSEANGGKSCKLHFCPSCLERHYKTNYDVETLQRTGGAFVCPRCQGFCHCSSCAQKSNPQDDGAAAAAGRKRKGKDGKKKSVLASPKKSRRPMVDELELPTSDPDIAWLGGPTSVGSNKSRLYFGAFRKDDETFRLGDTVLLANGDGEPFVARIDTVWQADDQQRTPMMQGTWFFRRSETPLAQVPMDNPRRESRELFLSRDVDDNQLASVLRKCTLRRFDHNIADVDAFLAGGEDRFFYRRLYFGGQLLELSDDALEAKLKAIEKEIDPYSSCRYHLALNRLQEAADTSSSSRPTAGAAAGAGGAAAAAASSLLHPSRSAASSSGYVSLCGSSASVTDLATPTFDLTLSTPITTSASSSSSLSSSAAAGDPAASPEESLRGPSSLPSYASLLSTAETPSGRTSLSSSAPAVALPSVRGVDFTVASLSASQVLQPPPPPPSSSAAGAGGGAAGGAGAAAASVLARPWSATGEAMQWVDLDDDSGDPIRLLPCGRFASIHDPANGAQASSSSSSNPATPATPSSAGAADTPPPATAAAEQASAESQQQPPAQQEQQEQQQQQQVAAPVPLPPSAGSLPQQPFSLEVHSNALLTIDFHGHLYHSEIIGLLGGTWEPAVRKLTVLEAFPCRPLQECSDAMNVEIDPVSEFEVRTLIQERGLRPVGWYHSHTEFCPDPSFRDCQNQSSQQRLSLEQEEQQQQQQPQAGNRGTGGVEPWVGAICATFDPRLPSPQSIFNWFVVQRRPASLATSSDMDVADTATDIGAPAAVWHTIVDDREVPTELRDSLKRLAKESLSDPDRTDFSQLWQDDVKLLENGGAPPLNRLHKFRSSLLSLLSRPLGLDRAAKLVDETTSCFQLSAAPAGLGGKRSAI